MPCWLNHCSRFMENSSSYPTIEARFHEFSEGTGRVTVAEGLVRVRVAFRHLVTSPASVAGQMIQRPSESISARLPQTPLGQHMARSAGRVWNRGSFPVLRCFYLGQSVLEARTLPA